MKIHNIVGVCVIVCASSIVMAWLFVRLAFMLDAGHLISREAYQFLAPLRFSGVILTLFYAVGICATLGFRVVWVRYAAAGLVCAPPAVCVVAFSNLGIGMVLSTVYFFFVFGTLALGNLFNLYYHVRMKMKSASTSVAA